jgi:hypothetical protein
MSNFDMVDYFESIPTRADEPKYQALSAFLRIESLCQQYWKEIPGDIQEALMEASKEGQRALERLPDGVRSE